MHATRTYLFHADFQVKSLQKLYRVTTVILKKC